MIYRVIAANSFGDCLNVFTSLGPLINLLSYLLLSRLPCNKDEPEINSRSSFDRQKLIFNVALRLGLLAVQLVQLPLQKLLMSSGSSSSGWSDLAMI